MTYDEHMEHMGWLQTEVASAIDRISSAWLDAFKTRPMLLRTVCEEAEKIPELRSALADACLDDDNTLNTRKLGRFLKRIAAKNYTNGHRFAYEDRGAGSLYWSLLPCEKKSNTVTAPAPSPQPDIHGDIHLMAMTILEKLQPVLLNAIYTELMEHKK